MFNLSKKYKYFIALFLILFTINKAVLAVNSQGDIDNNGRVDIFDYNQLLTDFGKVGANLIADLNSNGRVDIFDYNTLLSNFGIIIAPSPSPSNASSPTPSSAPVVSTEWVQFGHDSQRTNFTTQSVSTPWRYKWQWNGAGADGKQQPGHLSSPNLVQPITGGGRVYTIAGNSVIALSKTNGTLLWQKGSIGTLSSTAVYDNEFIYVASGNNLLYKINAADGTVINTFTAASALNLAPLLYGESLYVTSSSGVLYKIDKNSLSKIWEYNGGSPSATVPAYSPSKNAVVYLTQDLYVHSVNDTSGTRNWRVKPTVRNYQSGNPGPNGAQAEDGWPVIAEQHGLVFVRYRLDWDTLWTWNPYPTTNSQIRANLVSQPAVQALFALNLNDGSTSFIPAVGNGGAGDGGTLPMGPQPVIRTVGGQEVAYIIWRNGLTCASGWCDGREDAAMGEMVLDNTSVNGYSAGDVRFVRFIDIQTDEMMNLTMGNDTIFHSHWLINAAEKVTDRTAAKGATYTNPITTIDAPFVIWRQAYCPPSNSQCNPVIYPGGSGFTYGPANCPFDALRRYCNAGLYSYGDQRGYPAGFYEYHNDINSGTDPFTIVSDGMVLVKTNDGAIIALENGNPQAMSFSQRLAAIFKTGEEPSVLGEQNVPKEAVDHTQARKYVNQKITVKGRIESAVDHLPKAIYLGFKDPHDGELLVRIFNKDLSKFNYDPLVLKGKNVQITGFVTMYWPDNIDPEIIVSDPGQIIVED